MKNRSFFAWHLGYLTIIASIVGYSLHRYDREKHLRDFLDITVHHASKNAIDNRRGLYDGIQNTIDAFSSPANLQIRQQAQEADSLRRWFQAEVSSSFEASDAPGLRNTQRYAVAPLSAEKTGYCKKPQIACRKSTWHW